MRRYGKGLGSIKDCGRITKNGNKMVLKGQIMKMKIADGCLARRMFSVIISVTLFFCFITSVMAQGGDPLWGVPFQDVKPGETQEAMASALDSAGNLIVCGYQDVLGNSAEDYYTIKINNAGPGDNATVAWSKVYAGSGSGMDWATDVVVDGNDDIIVTGFASNGINDDIVTIKYSGIDGSEEWVHIFDGSSHANDYPNSISLDGAGNIYVVGYSQSGGLNSDEAIIFKLVPADVAANPGYPPAWVRVVNITAGGDDRFNDVHVGVSGIAVVGYATLTDHGGNANDYDYLTVMYSDNGTLIWQESYDNGYGSDEGRYVDIDSSGNVIITGKVLANAGREDIYSLKYPASGGAPLWSVSYDVGSPNLPKGLAVDANGDVYLSGYTFTNEGLEDYYTAKYDGNSGSVLWEDVYDSGLNNNDSAEALALDNDGGLFVTGFSDKNATDSDFLTLKYNTANGSLLWSDMHDSTEGGNQQTVGVAVGLGVSADGHVYVAGWTQSITNIDDLDYYAIKYDTGFLNRPTDLLITNYSESQVELSWVDNSYDFNSANPKNEDNFCVQRCTGFACDFSIMDYDDCSSPENSTFFQDGTVAKDTWYSYRVLATNTTYSDTRPSNTVSVWTTIIDFPAPTWFYTYDDTSDDSTCLSDPSIPTCRLDDMANAVAVGNDDNPVVTGLSASVNNQYDYYTVKFDRTNALTPIWADEYNGSDSQGDMGTCLVVDANGDVAVSGYSSRDSGTAAGNTNDIYTIKYAADGPDPYTGEPLWAIHYNGPGNDDDSSEAVAIVSDGSRYVAVVGYGRNMAQTGNDDIYLVKYQPDFAGMGIDQKVWAITPYDSGYNDYPQAVLFDPAGDLVVVGKSYNAAGNSDILINKYSGADGSQITGQNWPLVIDSGFGDDELQAVTIDKTGNIYVAGFISNNNLSRDWYINKFSGTGSALWTPKTVAGGFDMNNNAIEIAIDPNDGDIVIGGTIVNVSGSKDFHIARFSTNGTERWQKSVELADTTEELVAMAMSPSGDATLVGNSCKVGDKCRHGETISGASPDVMLVRYDYHGDITGSTLYDGGFNDFTTSAVSNKLGEVFVAGYKSTGPQATDDYDYLVFKSFDAPLQPPSPFSATPHYTTVDLSWTENDASVNGYRLFRLSGVCTDGGTDFSGAQQILGYTDQYKGLNFSDDTGVGSQGQTFCYGIQSHKAGSGDSRMIELEISLNYSVAPDNVTVTTLSSSEIELCWRDNTSEENYFGIQRCTGAACDFSGSISTFPATGMPNDTGLTLCYIDTNACDSGSGQTFRYRINAYNNTGSGWASGYSSTTADITPPELGVPSGLNAPRVAEVEVDLQWQDNSGDEADFIIERCLGAGCNSNYTQVGSVATVANNILHLRMDEPSWSGGTAGEVLDSSGKNNHGTSWNGVTTVMDGHAGRSGQFDGVDDFLTTPLVVDQSATSTGVTFMAWVKTDDVSAGDHYVLSSEDGATGSENNNWGILRSGAYWAVANGVNVESTGVLVDSGHWQHIAVVFTVSGYNFYFNGTEISKTTIGRHDLGAPITVGKQGNINGNYFNGLIDEAAVYDRSLASNEVAKLSTRGIFPETLGLRWFTDKTNSNTSVAYNTVYSYRVRARKIVSCGTTYSLPSNRIEVETIPQAPILTAVTIDRGTIALSWTPLTTTQTGYKIERCNGSLCTPVDLVSATVGAAEVTYVDTSSCFGLDGVLRYQISALGSWGISLPSSVAETVIIPDQLLSISVNDVTESKVDLQWKAKDSDRDGYRILRCTGGAGTCTPVSEVSASPVLYGDNALEALWQMDQLNWSGAVDEVHDSSGKNHHATAVNGASINTASKFGYGAGEFDGVDDYLSTNLLVDQSSNSTGVTLEAWVYPVSTSENKYHYVMSSSNSGSDYDLGFCFHDNGFWYVDTIYTIYYTNHPVVFNQWQHMVLVFDPAAGVKLFSNGVEIFSSSHISFEINSTLTIGRKGDAPQSYFLGKLDHIAVYSRPLSLVEVQERYNNGNMPIGTMAFSDEGNLSMATSYTYRVQPVKTTICGDIDDKAGYLDVTASTDLTPAAPDSLSAVAANTTEIDLSWHSNTSSETGFVLERCSGNSCDFSTNTTFSLGAGVESYSDTEVCQGSTYNYRIKSIQGSNWQSGYSLVTGASTPAAQVPVLSSLNALSESEIELSWTDPNIDEESFVVSRCQYDGNSTLCNQPADFADIASYLGSIQGLSLHYFMDESSWSGVPGEVIDTSGLGRHGQAYGGATTVMDGKYGSAGNFDGIDDRVISTLVIDQGVSSPGASFEAWVYPTVSDTNWRFLISTGHNNWGIIHYNNIWYIANGSSWVSTGVTVDVGTWSHIAAVFMPGTGVRFYKNGHETILNGIFSVTSAYNLTVGSRATSAYHFSGKIDEVLVYQSQLTQAQISAHVADRAVDYSYNDSSLTPDTTYYYKVTTKKESPVCGWVREVSGNAATPVPAPPANLQVVCDTTTCSLAWDDINGSETGYVVNRCDGDIGGTCNTVLDNTLIAGSNSFVDDTVCSDRSYTYSVYAVGSWGAWTATTHTDIVALSDSIPPVPLLTVIRVSEVQINLDWSLTPADETGIKLNRCLVGGGCTEILLAAGTTSYADDELVPNSDYTYTVSIYKIAAASCNGGWQTIASNIASASTGVPAITDLLATVVDSSTMRLTWTSDSTTETSAIIERCIGGVAACQNDLDFSQIDTVGNGVGQYTDIIDQPLNDCFNRQYSYRLKQVGEGLSNDGGGAWSEKARINFANFSPLSPVVITIDNSGGVYGGMNSDFSDIRFYDETAKRELPVYWIKEQVDGVSATVWLMTGANDNIYVYFGNPSATSSARTSAAFTTLYDDFQGTVIDSHKWLKIDPNGEFSQNDGLKIIHRNSSWDEGLFSTETFDRAAGNEVYVDFSIDGHNDQNCDGIAIGWGDDQTSSTSLNTMMYGVSINGSMSTIYFYAIDGGVRRSIITPIKSSLYTDYEMKIVLKDVGARYFLRGGSLKDWSLIYEVSSSHVGDDVLRLTLLNKNTHATIHAIRILHATGAAVSGLAAPEPFDGILANEWLALPSNIASATTADILVPYSLVVSQIEDGAVHLIWGDNNTEESGYSIERCCGASCNYAEVASVGADIFSYADMNYPDNMDCSYRVRAQKNAGTCSWMTPPSPVAAISTPSPAPTGFAATPVNGFQIDLSWNDVLDEEAYELEMQIWNGSWMPVADLAADTTTYTDTSGINPATNYTYRIRSVKGGVGSAYTEVFVMSNPYVQDDGTCSTNP